MRVSVVLAGGLMSASVLANTFEKWAPDSVAEFLKDRGVMPSSAQQDWTSAAKEEWQKILQKGEDWKYSPNFNSWYFDTWSKKDLYKFAEKYGLVSDESRVMSNKDLKQVILKNWNKIVESEGSKAEYPGRWLLTLWSEESLKAWLDKFGIGYNGYETKEELAEKVREHIFGTKGQSWGSWARNLWPQHEETWSEATRRHATGAYGSACQMMATGGNYLVGAKKDAQSAASKNYEKLFDSLSAEDLRQWLKENKQSTEGSVGELYARAVDAAKNEDFFSNWSVEAMRQWLRTRKVEAEGTWDEVHAKCLSVLGSEKRRWAHVMDYLRGYLWRYN